jgi:hypothetical protein
MGILQVKYSDDRQIEEKSAITFASTVQADALKTRILDTTSSPTHALATAPPSPSKTSASPSPSTTCCSDCSNPKCSDYPMCAPQCQNPTIRSCTFYADCVEASVPCGADGYALGYGQKYCNKYATNLDLFSTNGQKWALSVMGCLQTSLISVVGCDSTCASIRTAAFASHADCYVNAGFCSLSLCDLVVVVHTVGVKQLLSLESFGQEGETLSLCLKKELSGYDATQLRTLLSNECLATLEKTGWEVLGGLVELIGSDTE